MDRIKNIINGSTKKDKYKIRDRFRHLFQSVWFLITNSYCLLHNLNTESCRTKMEKVASPIWRKLQDSEFCTFA